MEIEWIEFESWQSDVADYIYTSQKSDPVSKGRPKIYDENVSKNHFSFEMMMITMLHKGDF